METTKKDKWNSNTVLFARRALEYAGVLEHTPEGSVLNVSRLLATDDRTFSAFRNVGPVTLEMIDELKQTVKWVEKA